MFLIFNVLSYLYGEQISLFSEWKQKHCLFSLAWGVFFVSVSPSVSSSLSSLRSEKSGISPYKAAEPNCYTELKKEKSFLGETFYTAILCLL